MQRITKTLAAAALAITAASGAAAQAGEINFHYNKHELETSFGVAQLYNRLARAAARACMSNDSDKPFWRLSAEKKCLNETTDYLVSQIDDPRLYAERDNAARFAQR